MKKFFTLLAVVLFAASSFAQNQNSGSKMSQNEIIQAIGPLIQKMKAAPQTEEGRASVTNLVMDYANSNKNEVGVYVVRQILASLMAPKELANYIENDDFYKNQPALQEIVKSKLNLEETAEGKMFKDFEAEYEGKVSKLSDWVGKGKYVLVDFWASWCGPCKAEIPNIINVYNKYKGDKFEVLGVTVNDKPEETLKSIEKLGINYPQMINAQRAGSTAYGIQGIPHIILFGPDGTILKRNLRGENIEKAVSEYLSK